MKLTEKQLKEIGEAYEALQSLSQQMDERISDLHQVKGAMQARHAYCYYREKVWKAQYTLRDIFNM